jgi:hypothetical protein
MIVKSEADKKELLNKIKSGKLSESEELDLLDGFLGVKKKTPIQIKVEQIWAQMRANPEIKEIGAKLISIIKTNDGTKDEEVAKRQKIFNAAVAALEV